MGHGQSLKATDLVYVQVGGVCNQQNNVLTSVSSQSYKMIENKNGNSVIWAVSFCSKRF